MSAMPSARRASSDPRPSSVSPESRQPSTSLRSGWILANHKFMAFHVAALLGVLGHLVQLAWEGVVSWEFIGFFFTVELGSGVLIAFVTWHTVISIHEIGHFMAAGRSRALRADDQARFDAELEGAASRTGGMAAWYLAMFFAIPYGRFWGVKKTEGGYFVPLEMGGDATLAVSAAGPIADQKTSRIALPIGLIAYGAGLAFLGTAPGTALVGVYVGRLFMALGVVSFLDISRTDDGAYRRYREWLAAGESAQPAATATDEPGGYTEARRQMMASMRSHGMYRATSPDGTRRQWAPWQMRNTIQGGDHVRHQGGNLTFQEFMIVPVAANAFEAAEICNSVQDRATQIIQNSEGMKFVGVGIEGGIVGTFEGYEDQALDVLVQAITEAGYEPGGTRSNILDNIDEVRALSGFADADPGDRTFLESTAYPEGRLATDLAPEEMQCLSRVLKELGHRPGVWLAIDVAAHSLAEAYRDSAKSDAIGWYQLYMRPGTEQKVVTSDDLLRVYADWIAKYPLISIEDPYSADDWGAWQKMTRELGDEVLVVGDDLIVTNDTIVAEAIDNGSINVALIKPNQIGTITETLLAIDASRVRDIPTIVSHRSKSGIDFIEAELALAVGALGMKCGGAKLAERIHKYQRVADAMERISLGYVAHRVPDDVTIDYFSAVEAQTSAGPATTRVLIELSNGVCFEASVPVATSGGPDEAVHLVDGDPSRFAGKGTLRAVSHVNRRIAPQFVGRRLNELGTIADVDRELLRIEMEAGLQTFEELRQEGKLAQDPEEQILQGALPPTATDRQRVRLMQRKANLGMNAVLPVSIVLMRVLAAREGLEPEEYMRAVIEAGIDREALYNPDVVASTAKPEPSAPLGVGVDS